MRDEDRDPLFWEIGSDPYRPEGDQVVLLCFRGDPVPAPRVRVTRHGAYMPERYQAYRDGLRWAVRAALAEQQEETAVAPSLPGGGGLDPARRFGVKAFFFRKTYQRTDVDNLLKTLCDAGTGLLWHDDSQIIEQYGRTWFGAANPRVVFLVYEFEPQAVMTHPCQRCGKPIERLADRGTHQRRYCSAACRHPAGREVGG